MGISRQRALLYLIAFAFLIFLATHPPDFLYLLASLFAVVPFVAVGFILFLIFRFPTRQQVFTAKNATGPLGPELLAETDGAPSTPRRAVRITSPLFIAVLLIGFGLTCSFGLLHWFFRPINQAIALTPGTIRTRHFKLIGNAYYRVKIVVDPTMEQDPACPASPDWNNRSILKARWTIFREGQPYVSDLFNYGSYLPMSDLFNYGSYLPMAEFEAVPGDYQLELQVLADASCLQKLHPRLVVEADEESYSLLLETLGLSPLPYLCIAAGVVMVSLRVFDRRRESRVTTGVAGEDQLGPAIYQPRVRRALQEKFGGMPAFGTVAALTMFVILVPVWIFSSWRIPTKGLFVGVSAKEYLRATANRSVGPLIVSVEIRKHEVAYRLNGKAVPFVDLNSALKQELSRRADWVVFVEGEDNLPYEDVAQVIDIAHGLQARSVLLTPQMKKGH